MILSARNACEALAFLFVTVIFINSVLNRCVYSTHYVEVLKMTNKEILNIALQQSAYDCNCNADDFLSEKNIITISKANPKARRYLPLPLECDLVTYGNNIVAQVSERTKVVVTEYINKYPAYRCFETPNINVLNTLLSQFDLKVCFMAEYFLPDVTKLKELDCG